LDGLLTANMSAFQGTHLFNFLITSLPLDSLHDDTATTQFAIRATDILIDILQDTNLDLTTKSGPPHKALSSSSPARVPPSLHSNIALKFSITCDLWTVVHTAIPLDLMVAAGEKLLACLVDIEDDWVWEMDLNDDARKQWAMFCAGVLLAFNSDELKLFWGGRKWQEGGLVKETHRRALGMGLCAQVEEGGGGWNWEGAIILLDVPFVLNIF